LFGRGEVSPLELVDAAIERIERVDPVLNAVIDRQFSTAASSLPHSWEAGRSGACRSC